MSILLDVGIGLEINVLTSKFILLGYQMLGEMGCHPEICFYLLNWSAVKFSSTRYRGLSNKYSKQVKLQEAIRSLPQCDWIMN